MRGLTAADLGEALALGGVSMLRARDVPERHRKLFELGRAGLAGSLGYVGARRSPDLAEAHDMPSWLPAAVAVGGGVLAYASHGLTQRTEDALDRRLLRLGVQQPRLVLAGGSVVVQLVMRWRARRDAARTQVQEDAAAE